MNKAKLNKMLADAKKGHQKAAEKLQKVSDDAARAASDLKVAKQDVKETRKRHKEARKVIRGVTKKLELAESEYARASGLVKKLEKKWMKLNPASRQTKRRSKVKKPASKPSKPHKRTAPKKTLKIAAVSEVEPLVSRIAV